ncbi:MAG: S8 family serine peptidase [Polyangiaceae bacterium]|nr:S8 family serine peptidase [Polyangiaceae bacterium]
MSKNDSRLAIPGILISALLAACDSPPPGEEDQSAPHGVARSTYFQGLEETVLLIKAQTGSIAVRPNGEPLSIAALKQLDRKAWRTRYGAMTPTLVDALRTTVSTDSSPAPESTSPASEPGAAQQPTIPFYVVVPAGGASGPAQDALDAALRSPDEQVASGARATLQQQVTLALDAIVPQLEALGVVVEGRGTLMPLLWGRGTAAQLEAAAFVPDIVVLGSAQPGTPLDQADVESQPVFHASSAAFPGLTGAGEKAAVIDSGACKVRDTHHFIDRSVNYQDTGPAPSCSGPTDSSCNNTCLSEDSYCEAGHCLDGHGTEVLGIVGQMLPDAELYYPNVGEPNWLDIDSVQCTPAIVHAYEYLVSNGVKFVNESYECENAPRDFDGVIEDYFSRKHGVLITKSANNKANLAACSSTWNGICVGGVNLDKEMYCNSSYRNDIAGDTDREEPDVVAYAGDGHPADCPGVPDQDVLVASAAGDSLYAGKTGNSFASPAVLSLAVLMKEFCESQGQGTPNNLELRAMIINGATRANPDGWRYSTSKPGQDHKDGGGFIDGPGLRVFCTTGGNEIAIKGAGTIYPQESGTLGMPESDPEYPDVPPQSNDGTLQPANQDLLPSKDGASYKYINLFATQPGGGIELEKGNRIRVTFSWEACAYDGNGDEPVTDAADRSVATDFDLFLYNATIGRMFYASQSFDDVNEGFDVTIPSADWNGSYQAILVWPKDATGCDGKENYAWGGRVWR